MTSRLVTVTVDFIGSLKIQFMCKIIYVTNGKGNLPKAKTLMSTMAGYLFMVKNQKYR